MKHLSIVLLALALAACGTSAADQHAGHSPTTVNLTVGAGDFRFEPASLELIAGQRVTIVVRNTGTQSHDFTVQALPLAGAAVGDPLAAGDNAGHVHDAEGAAVHVAVAPGATGSVEFTPAAAGTYEFDCTVPGHKAAGMVGTLNVKAP